MRMKTIGAGVLLLAMVGEASAITIVFDYSYDSNNFFSGPNVGRRAVLNQAAAVFTSFNDSLAAIQPSGSNHWTMDFSAPDTGTDVSLNDPVVPANTVIVYAGGRALGGPLGVGGPGGWGISYNSETFLNAVRNRGQAGAQATPPTDFAQWGGSITFNTGANWWFGLSNDTSGLSGKNDFYSVAVHELAHLLGFGLAESWNAKITGGAFTGANAKLAYNNLNVPLAGSGHWAYGTMSKVNGLTTQEAAMDPDLLVGSRKFFTDLDYAAMRDIGWQVPVPEPMSFSLLLLGASMLTLRRKRA